MAQILLMDDEIDYQLRATVLLVVISSQKVLNAMMIY